VRAVAEGLGGRLPTATERDLLTTGGIDLVPSSVDDLALAPIRYGPFGRTAIFTLMLASSWLALSNGLKGITAVHWGRDAHPW
jgi:hypothetical protein